MSHITLRIETSLVFEIVTKIRFQQIYSSGGKKARSGLQRTDIRYRTDQQDRLFEHNWSRDRVQGKWKPTTGNHLGSQRWHCRWRRSRIAASDGKRQPGISPVPC